MHRAVYVTEKFELEIKAVHSESSELATDCGFGVSVCILLLSAVNCRLGLPTSQGSRDGSQGGRISIHCLVHHADVKMGLEKEDAEGEAENSCVSLGQEEEDQGSLMASMRGLR